MSLFRFKLDGTYLQDEPEGWRDILSELRRDKEIRGQLLLMDLTLKFKGGTDGYNHLKPLIDCQGFCTFSTLEVEESCNNDQNDFTTIFEGIILYTLVKEFLFPCVLECKIKDNSYAAKIDNNKNIEAYVNVGRSKNDETISAAQEYQVRFFDVVTGNYLNFVKVYPVWTCFEFIIDYMTDGEMDFMSDYFKGNLLGETEGQFITITTGEQIRLQAGGGSVKFPFISFKKLFEEVNKKVRISFAVEIDSTTGRKRMRIEPESYFFNTGISTTLSNVKGIIKSVNTAELYSRLQIGSSQTIKYVAGQTDFPTDISFAGYKDETYTITGKCNIDNTLNLVSDWIIDSNIVQAVFSNNDDGYDDDIFFIMADYVTDPFTPVAIQYDVFNNTPPFFYNGFLRNSEVAQRWLGGIPNSIALYLGNGNDEFRASGTNYFPSSSFTVAPTSAVQYGPFNFDDDFTPPNFDSNGNYDNVTFSYVAPATGLFTFHSLIPVEISPAPNSSFGGEVRILGSFQVFNAVNVLQYTLPFADSGPFIFSSQFVYNLEGSLTLYLPAGFKVIVVFRIESIITSFLTVFRVLPSRIFECSSTSTGGGIFQTYNPEDFKAYQYEFEYPITFAQYQTIIANPLKQLAFNDGVNNYSGWIENMKYRHMEGKADFVLSKSLLKTTCE